MTARRFPPASRPAALLAGCAMLGACILPELDLAGRPCPCAEGFSCDATTNTCVEGDSSSTQASSSSVVGSSTQSAGPSSTTSQGSAGGGSGGEGGLGEGGATTSSSSTGGEGGEGGAGGSGGCAIDQTTNVPMCGGFFDTFDDPVQFAVDWTFTGPPAAFVVAESRLTITLEGTSTLAAYAPPTFDMVGCGITVRLLDAPDVPDVVGRLSIAPEGAPSRFSIGVVEGILQVREGDDVVVATGYDDVLHRYLRIREEAGSLYFATSADGVCWDERHDVASDDTIGIVGRLVLAADGGTGPTSAAFDDYCYVPPG